MWVRGDRKTSKREASSRLIFISFAAETLALALISSAIQVAIPGQYTALLHVPATLFFLLILGAWKSTMFRDRSSGFVVVTKGVSLSLPGYTALASTFGQPVAMQSLLTATSLMLAGLLAFRWGVRKLVFGARAGGHLLEQAAIIGTQVEIDDLRLRILKNPMFGYEPAVSICIESLELPVGATPGSSIIESLGLSEVSLRARLEGVSTVFVGPSVSKEPQTLEALLWSLRSSGLEIYLNKTVGYLSSTGFELIPAYNSVLLRMKDSPYRASSAALKRLFDIVFSFTLLTISLPLQLSISVAIVALDRQAPLFIQKRVGLNGVEFNLWKFKTMRTNSIEQRGYGRSDSNRAGNEVQFKLRRDPRVTPLGRWLRKYSLDELPQLFNVLSGKMSLVGPRPHVAEEVERYEELALNRLRLKPGLTGAWQVSGRSDLDWEDSIAIDLNYVQNWSLALDFVILVSTIWAVIRGKGAY